MWLFVQLSKENRYRRWVPSICCAIIIFAVSIIPLQNRGHTTMGIGFILRVDIILHVVGYAVLAWAIVGARKVGLTDYDEILLILIFVTVFGAGIEGIQAIIPTRQSSITDMIANAVGATTIFIPSVFDCVRQRYQ